MLKIWQSCVYNDTISQRAPVGANNRMNQKGRRPMNEPLSASEERDVRDQMCQATNILIKFSI